MRVAEKNRKCKMIALAIFVIFHFKKFINIAHTQWKIEHFVKLTKLNTLKRLCYNRYKKMRMCKVYICIQRDLSHHASSVSSRRTISNSSLLRAREIIERRWLRADNIIYGSANRALPIRVLDQRLEILVSYAWEPAEGAVVLFSLCILQSRRFPSVLIRFE